MRQLEGITNSMDMNLSKLWEFVTSLPGSPVPGIFQARTLEWVAISFSNAWMRPYRRQATRLLCPWDSPGKNTGAGCHFLLQCMDATL